MKNLEELVQEEEKKIIESFPNDPKEFTKKQLEWVLEHHHDSGTSLRYKFSSDFLQKLGFYASGFFEDTKQFCLKFSVENDIDIFDSLKILKKAIKIRNVESRGQKTEVGISLIPLGLSNESYDRPIAYYHEDETVTLYLSKYKSKDFKSFECFLSYCKDHKE